MIFKRLSFIASIIILTVLQASTPAQAWLHPGNTTPTIPVLTASTVTFGQSTQSGYGAVQLSAQDFTSPSYVPLPVSGLGLMSPSGPACDHWTMTFVSNTSSRPGSDFTIISANTPEGVGTAITPKPSGTGVGNLAGDYVWNVSCTANSISSNTVHLTYHTIANAANIAQFDTLSGGWAPSGFGSSSGSKVLISTGADMHATVNYLWGVTLGSTNGNRLVITVADSPRYPYISNLTTSGLSNIDVTDIQATGNTDITVNAVINIFGSDFGHSAGTTNETWENLHYWGSMLMYPSTGANGCQNCNQDAFANACVTNCLLQNSSSDFTAEGFSIADNLTVTNVDIGHYADNCSFTNSLFVGATLNNVSCHDPLYPLGGLHVDCLQIGDGATAYNLTVKNMWCISAGAVGYAQGPWFGGSQIGGTTSAAAGYIDDGTGAHGPGTVLTLTSGFTYSSSNGAQIWSPGNITIAQNVRIGCGGSCVTNLAATVLGSPASPIAISNVGVNTMQEEGIVITGDTQNGIDSVGESGTSFVRHFAIVQQYANPEGNVSFTANINGSVTSPAGVNYATGTTATVTSTPIPSSISQNPIIGGALMYSGCPTSPANAYCSLAVTGNGVSPGLSIGGEFWSTESVQATGTATFSSFGGIYYMTIAGPCTGRWDYAITNGAKTGGLMVQGTGVRDQIFIVPALNYPSDGCAGTYALNDNPIATGPVAVTGRPSMQGGVYGLYNYGTGAATTGSLTMTSTAYVGLTANNFGFQQEPRACTTTLHQGTFQVQYGYADGGVSLCGAPVTNTTTSGIISPVAADYATGILPSVSLSAITAATWDALDSTGGSAQKKALTCNKMLPKVGGALDLGSGNFAGPFTATGEIQLASGNVAITGCGIH